jgi:transforming growth factor-beta-induced protein
MKLSTLLTSAMLAVTFPAISGADDVADRPTADIVDTAVAAGSFQTLAAALSAADLVEALRSDGPFTVFAPTDDAFAKLPPGTIETLLKPENQDQLVDILTYHVVATEVPAEVALTLDEAEALNGEKITLTRQDGALFLNDAQVVQTDIIAANGIIHVIDTVLLPPSAVVSTDPVDATAAALVSMAIEKGAPLYNHGNHAACAAVYEMAAAALLLMPEGTLTGGQTKMLRTALMTVRRSSNPTDNAWTLRRAFDQMMAPMM